MLSGTKAYIFAFTLFSMAGIPPTIGFITKYYILLNGIIVFQFLSILAIFISLISTYYYIHIVKIVIFKNARNI